MQSEYSHCVLCPRACGIDRITGMRGFCGQGPEIRAAWAGLHFGEEPVITGKRGSGAVFFSGCTLRCSLCQNYQLSRESIGKDITANQLADIIIDLQEKGAENINLITGTQFVPGITEALKRAKSRGFSLPVVWNTSGYEQLSTLKKLFKFADIFLPDCKTLDPVLSEQIMKAKDYPVIAEKALLEMAEAKPLSLEEKGIIQGVIVRHLVLPGCLDSTQEVLKWFSENLNGKALISIMFQYIPIITQTRVKKNEYKKVLSWLDKYGIEHGFIQEMSSGDKWLPDFTRLNPFPRGQAQRVWSCI